MNGSQRVMEAVDFAVKAHAGQARRYTGEPYVMHPMAVAALVRLVKDSTEDMVIAALLHDVVEDTAVTLREIEEKFGPTVARLVSEVTKPKLPGDPTRTQRNVAYQKQLMKASPEAQTIKLADILDNISTIAERDPRFAKSYLYEKAAQLPCLLAGDMDLWVRVNRILRDQGV